MAMTFNKPAQQTQTAPSSATQGMEIIEVQPYDIVADRDQTSKALAHSPEVEALTAGIDVNDLDTIVSFGAESAEEISKASDLVLRSMNMSQIDETSKMLGTLSKIMDQFDINEIKDTRIDSLKWIVSVPSYLQTNISVKCSNIGILI